MLLAEKSDGRIIGRTCVNGIKKWSHIKREYSTSPMVSLEDIMITSSIEAREGRKVDKIYIPV